MTNNNDHPFLRGMSEPATFMSVPYSSSVTESKAAILGIPFDCGQHPTRIGARGGPRAIRAQSSLVRRYQPPFADFDPLEDLGVVDMGDVAVTSAKLKDAMQLIEAAMSHIFEQDVVPITFGGDGAVTLPQLRATQSKYPDLCAVHLDAHADASLGNGPGFDERYNTATTFTRAAEEQLVDTPRSYHIGARGTLPLQGTYKHAQGLGYQLITTDVMLERGIPNVAEEVHQTIGNRPVYLCFDMDFFDPSCAPGVCTPTWGGPTAREGLALLRWLSGLNIVAVDINTVSPDHDVGGMTAFLAGTVAMECATLIAMKKRQDAQSDKSVAATQTS